MFVEKITINRSEDVEEITVVRSAVIEENLIPGVPPSNGNFDIVSAVP